MKYFELMDIFVRFYVSSYSYQAKNPQIEVLKNTRIAFVDELKLYTLKIPFEAKITPKIQRATDLLILKRPLWDSD